MRSAWRTVVPNPVGKFRKKVSKIVDKTGRWLSLTVRLPFFLILSALVLTGILSY